MIRLMYQSCLFPVVIIFLLFSCKKNEEIEADEPLMVYIGAKDGYLYAVDATDGSQKWKYYTKTSLDWSSAAIDEGVFMLAARTIKYMPLTPYQVVLNGFPMKWILFMVLLLSITEYCMWLI